MLYIGTMTSKVGIVDICAVKVSSHDLSSHVKIAFYIYREDQDYMCSIQCWIASCSHINQNPKILLPMFSHGPPRNQAVACHHVQAVDGRARQTYRLDQNALFPNLISCAQSWF